ncbi:hypothetical protein FGIG_06217 [Fasciola gigantica]|uniref:Uncharacterized protein n=1 Tax=Fasciola gigantica TaxID=46835 RepID=A0A504Y6E8_FASGI|nr:hypothetical protein FGIG_06217 [Fasciola gigantica]
MEETLADCFAAFFAALDNCFGRVGLVEAMLLAKLSSIIFVTLKSFLSTPGPMATESPSTQATLHSHLEKRLIPPHPNMDSITNPSTPFDPSRFHDDESACWSLKLPHLYTAHILCCHLVLSANTSAILEPSSLKPSDYFVTDAGLLLPSRPPKSSPYSDLALSPSQMRAARPTGGMSTADRHMVDPGNDQKKMGNDASRTSNWTTFDKLSFQRVGKSPF